MAVIEPNAWTCFSEIQSDCDIRKWPRSTVRVQAHRVHHQLLLNREHQAVCSQQLEMDLVHVEGVCFRRSVLNDPVFHSASVDANSWWRRSVEHSIVVPFFREEEIVVAVRLACDRWGLVKVQVSCTSRGLHREIDRDGWRRVEGDRKWQIRGVNRGKDVEQDMGGIGSKAPVKALVLTTAFPTLLAGPVKTISTLPAAGIRTCV